MGFDLGGGVLGDAFGALTGTVDAATGGWWSDQSTKKSAKRNYKYNSWLQQQNQDFQKYMAMNAHQMEMMDLQEAGLNPALTATGSSAGAIAGSSSAQGTSPGQAVDTLMNVVNGLNAMRTTNANITKTEEETKAIPQQIENETTNAKANLLAAQASMKQANETEKMNKGGKGANLFGSDNGGLLSSIATVAAPFIGGGLGMGAIKGFKAYKAFKASKGFGNFLKSLNSAK